MTLRDQVETHRSSAGALPPRRRALLVFVGDTISTRPLPLTGELVIGRGESADIVLDHPSISRAHLRLVLADDQMTAVDLDSANGTTLRGARARANVAFELAANEPIGVGDVTLLVQEVRPMVGAGGAPPRSARDSTAGTTDAIVADAAMRRLVDLARRLAPGTISVLLVGETGTGKELVAELIHRSSKRAKAPLVRINCAALADSLVESELFGHEAGAFTGAQRERRGLLESAHGGTVFLDEIGELPLGIQAKLLRVLEEGAVTRVGGTTPRPLDARFIAATNRDLEDEVAAGRFRQDLYYRVAGGVLSLPPLRERPDDLEPIARSFVTATATRLERPAVRLGDAALAALRAHSWPGNVRELRNVIERAILVSDTDTIEPHHLPFAGPATAEPATLGNELADLERKRILEALEACGGNQTRAAERLGMPRRTLIKRITAYGIDRPRKR